MHFESATFRRASGETQRLSLEILALVSSKRTSGQSAESVHKELKNDLSIRPIYHQLETRIEAHIFIAFLAYCLLVTLKQRLKTLAPGLTARVVLEKLAAMQMIDVELPTTDDRVVVLSRYTEPEKDLLLLLRQLKLRLPAQPPPKINDPDSREST